MKLNANPKLRYAYHEAMKFFDAKCEEYQTKTKYRPLVKIIVENRRLELINKFSKLVQANEVSTLAINDMFMQIKEIEKKTDNDLLELHEI